ncbi:MAG: bifunctional serine/threonine-protein kinase/formylglycine-generating enzyme family protein [Prochloraceae cyanobacterium]|nr:bifunctional serine/threonine-protein kinase/formylglycine-generating enzyme family protein [Prochloraceae cyanobacterium]
MICCLNPDCDRPFNPENRKHCQNCGALLKKRLRNHYRVLKPLGRGGFGKTYLALDTDKLDELCVVKQLAPLTKGLKASLKLRDLFDQEAQQLQRLGEHSQIPALRAYFEEDNYLYLVQEFIEGQNLLKKLKTQGVFTENQIKELLLDILPVLQFVHDRGVIHRDLKPGNIMYRVDDAKYVLIDFGICKVTPSIVGHTGTSLGSLGYAAPEQILDGQATPSSDLFGLGVCCFHLMAGEHPNELFEYQGFGWVKNWQQLMPNILGTEIAYVLDKLLKRDISQRYQQASEVLKYLHKAESVQQEFVEIAPQPLVSDRVFTSSLQTFNFEVITVDTFGKPISHRHQKAKYFVENLGYSVTLTMVAIPSGKFLMGSTEPGYDSERPQHEVTVEPFFMSKFLITQAQWKEIALLPKVNRDLNPDPSEFKGYNRPVETVSWYDAIEFCDRLSRETEQDYRLPSEAQWEYACRGNTTSPFHFGATITSDLANYDANYTYANESRGKYRGETTEVGLFPPNAFGLYDMHGNVYEWCADVWHNDYQEAPTDGSAWLDRSNQDNQYQVLRGGSWFDAPIDCRSACRDRVIARRNNIYDLVGFRVVCVIKK